MSEKKKVAILLPWLKMGGTNKIALHFMKELSQYCDVTLILSEHTGELLKKERAKYDDRVTPAIILIPGVFGNTGEGIARVKGSVEQAVGSDILFGNE